MNYELAKQLKEAGFQNTKYKTIIECMSISLSELIEACGDRDGIVIWRFNGKWRAGECEEWGGRDIYGEVKNLHVGSTPEEAVAKLYIALNKNNLTK